MKKYIRCNNEPKIIRFKDQDELNDDRIVIDSLSSSIDSIKYRICEYDKERINDVLSRNSFKFSVIMRYSIGEININSDIILNKLKSLSDKFTEFSDYVMPVYNIITIYKYGKLIKSYPNLTLDTINNIFNEDFSDYIKL